MKHFMSSFPNGRRGFTDYYHPKRVYRVRRGIKDRLFRFLFDKDREALLQLYNALNGTDYKEASKLQVVTIESVVYVVMKNDLAFMIAGVLNLYEHQSTFNPNMPVRFLIYLAEEYQMFVEKERKSLYGTTLIKLPTPRCVVFYNGDRDMPEKQTLRLSDAFENRDVKADVELEVKVLNINYGNNVSLMEHCRVLSEYAQFVEITKQFTKNDRPGKKALNDAIKYCIENGILSDFLKEYRQEVLGMLLDEFDVKKYERTLREEGWEAGREEGWVAGRTEGIDEGKRNIIANMIQKGMSDETIKELAMCEQRMIDEVRGKRQG